MNTPPEQDAQGWQYDSSDDEYESTVSYPQSPLLCSPMSAMFEEDFNPISLQPASTLSACDRPTPFPRSCHTSYTSDEEEPDTQDEVDTYDEEGEEFSYKLHFDSETQFAEYCLAKYAILQPWDHAWDMEK